MVSGKYEKQKILKWTPELSATFEHIKKVVSECPTMFFLDDKLPIFLHTDASDYGIGAYLFQRDENNNLDKPVGFISKSLAKERLNWSVPEKEAYAIFYALQKLEYLLRDVYFVIRTDHKNLTYINQEGSPIQVRRCWKLAIQEYNFDIEYIPGEENSVADAFSRLCLRAENNGTQNVNSVIKEHLELVGVEHQLTLAYSSEENAIVERANKEVLRHLRAIVLDKNIKNDWSQCLPIVQRIMNASVHSATGYSIFTCAVTFWKLHNFRQRNLFANKHAQERSW